MSNLFQTLDQYFPCGNARVAGEVVHINLRFLDGNVAFMPHGISWKEKAWYRNASQNAMFMYRGVCRELREQPWYINSGWTDQRAVKLLIRTAIQHAYMRCAVDDEQYTEYDITRYTRVFLRGRPARSHLFSIQQASPVMMHEWESVPFSFR